MRVRILYIFDIHPSYISHISTKINIYFFLSSRSSKPFSSHFKNFIGHCLQKSPAKVFFILFFIFSPFIQIISIIQPFSINQINLIKSSLFISYRDILVSNYSNKNLLKIQTEMIYAKIY